MRKLSGRTFLLAILLVVTFDARAQTLSPDLTEKIDKLAGDTLARTGVPSASIAIVKDGQIIYVKAYGDARLEPKTPAASQMRYSVGSIRISANKPSRFQEQP